MDERHRLIVDPETAGLRLDVFLAGVLPQHSRSQFQRLIREGRVTVEGTSAKPNSVLRAGQTIEVDIPPPAPATPLPQELPLPIVYQDEDVIVVEDRKSVV